MSVNAAVKTSEQIRSGVKIDVSIIGLLEWAFQREKAVLNFDDPNDASPSGFGLEFVLMEQARLGCRVDGGGRSSCHPDADLVVDALTHLPEALGGARMAIWIAELSRSGLTPNYGADGSARCEPVEWKRSKHGWFAMREYWCGQGRWPSPRLGKNDGYACPVTYSNTSVEVGALRRGYLTWRLALLELRCWLKHVELTSFSVTNEMPPATPWKETS